MIKPNQRGRANDNVILKCLVEVNVNENNPIVLLNKIRKKSLKHITIFIFLFFKRGKNSFIIEFMILLKKFL
jgi:hypothetical protein